MDIQRGRHTADIDGDFVVFLIGMRLNHPLRVRKWWPVATAMPKMLTVLRQHPELGCLGFQQWLANAAAARIGASKADLPAVEPY